MSRGASHWTKRVEQAEPEHWDAPPTQRQMRHMAELGIDARARSLGSAAFLINCAYRIKRMSETQE